jgi:hypothetical protein
MTNPVHRIAIPCPDSLAKLILRVHSGYAQIFRRRSKKNRTSPKRCVSGNRARLFVNGLDRVRLCTKQY